MVKPILFNTEMVKALIEGRKTNTRRIIKNEYENTDIAWFENKYGKRLVYMQNDVPPPVKNEDGTTSHKLIAMEEIKKPCEVGDILYVRETWNFLNCYECDACGSCHEYPVKYKNNEGCFAYKVDSKVDMDLWKPSIHMPKVVARIFLKVADVRAERLQDMEVDDFLSEGIKEYTKDGQVLKYALNEEQYTWRDMPRDPQEPFEKLWNSTINKFQTYLYGWDANPWVWVIEFEKISKEEKE